MPFPLYLQAAEGAVNPTAPAWSRSPAPAPTDLTSPSLGAANNGNPYMVSDAGPSNFVLNSSASLQGMYALVPMWPYLS